MGAFANSRLTSIMALIGTVVVLALNVVLIAQTIGVPISGLSGAPLTARRDRYLPDCLGRGR